MCSLVSELLLIETAPIREVGSTYTYYQYIYDYVVACTY